MKSVAVIIPCFNEARRLQVKPICSFIQSNNKEFDFYFVDDGSTDSTDEIISSFFLKNNSHVFLVILNRNLGKGNAIREGIIEAKKKNYSYYGFIDADLDIPFRQVLRLHQRIIQSEYSLAISYRNLSSSFRIRNPRTIGSLAVVIVANIILDFKPKIKDTQCGCKMFSENIIEIFRDPFISEWLFDIELLLRLRELDENTRGKICEVPLISLGSSSNSKLKLNQSRLILSQLIKIYRYYK